VKLAEVMTPHGVDIPAHLVADAEIPVLTGLQRQGDVIIRPTRSGQVANLKPIPAAGIAVVRGESGGNTHLLVGDGLWVTNTTDPAIMGTLRLEDSQEAHLIHPEHGAMGIGPGTYVFNRQREQAEQARLIAD
jgi:hypothetical protein